MLKRWIVKSCLVLSVFFLLLLGACAKPPQNNPPDLLDDNYDEEETSSVSDPLEPLNRGTFWFNKEVVYDLGLTPASDAYDFVTPDLVQTGIGNFFHNSKILVRLLEDLATFDVKNLGKDTFFFTVNSVGLWFIDLRSTQDRSDRGDGNFSKALAYWGIPPGTYIVWPLIGPSNLRDSVGSIVNFILNPATLAGSPESFILGAIDKIDGYHRRDKEIIDTIFEVSLDPYTGTREAYYDISKKRLAE
ncbi:hypothetical protein EOM39_06070 [Candidatus Gracilibacteria bacterium]|nr:hypothetical protein [Candidatus Gracilibacteria bacterium]